MRWIVFIFLSFFLNPLVYGNNSFTPSKKQQINKLIQEKLPNTNIGIIIQEAKSGKILFQRKSNEAFPPASTAKLFTSAVGLWMLGPTYQYQTDIRIQKEKIKNKTLSGNLYIKFSGDPSLTIEDLKTLVKTIKVNGIDKIEGDIVLDTTRFQGFNYALGWVWDSLNWYFAPPITTVILNQNLIKVVLDSNKDFGQKAEINLSPEEVIKTNLIQEVTVVTELEAEKKCQLEVNLNQENEIYMKGCWPKKEKPFPVSVALKNPTLLAKTIIQETLEQEKIMFNEKILEGITPEETSILASHASEPLEELIKPILQDSNNLYADSLLKTLGAEKFQKGSFQAGVEAVKEVLLKQADIKAEDIQLFDGSGLSTYNLIRPIDLAKLLQAIYQDEKSRQLFINALAVSGEMGTLKNRLNSDNMKGRFRGKTGSYSGVSTLAGYLKTSSNHDLIVVIMIDHLFKDGKTKKEFEDSLFKILGS